MHDCAYFEAQGLPSAAVLSEMFLQQAHYQAGGLGLSQVAGLLNPVAHPISDQTVAQLHAKADACFDSVLGALLVGASTSEEKDDLNQPLLPAATDCMA